MCFKCVFAALFGVTAHHPGSFPPLPSLFPLFFQCDGCLFPSPAWGLMAELPGFASHGRHSLSKSWLPIVEDLDVPDTQPPLSNAVFNIKV